MKYERPNYPWGHSLEKVELEEEVKEVKGMKEHKILEENMVAPCHKYVSSSHSHFQA